MHFKNELVEALLKELEIQKNYLGNEPVDSIYIGGGTPSLCTGEELKKLVQTIQHLFNVSKDAEITLESNPDDITEAALIAWKTLGINRLSIGIQSFFEEDLQWMNRAHHADQAAVALQLATIYFNNITIDLIYGFPLLSNEKWKENVKRVIASGIPHISSYALTVEPKTPLDKMIRVHRAENVDPDKQSEQFFLLMQWMEEAGYEHYEISNFSKPAAPAGRPGWRSRHNSAYWQGKKYLGIGPSAHSFDIVSRQWNVSNNQLYISAIQKNELPFEKEILTETQKLNEYIMTSLRTMEGMDLGITGNELLEKSRKYLESGQMILVNQSLVLTKEGKLLADGIAADLFF